MATQTRPTEAPPRYMQGVAVPASSVRPQEFFGRTRRHIRSEKTFSYTGQAQEIVELRKADIVSEIAIRFTGKLTTTKGTGTVATTRRWPYDILRAVKLTANGASNLINVSGLKLKARDIMKKSDLTDRGVSQKVGANTVTNGSLAQASESWGVGSGETALAAGSYDVELEWIVPVAEDQHDLQGAIFLATSSTGITLTLDLATAAELFVTTGDGTAALTGDFQVISTKYSIPIGGDGQIVVPDLSVFHSMIESRYTSLQTGENEIRLVGQGAGKALLRLYWQLWNGAAAAAVPVVMNASNYGKQMWRYANNETPDEFVDGHHLRLDMERRYNSDLGAVWGFGSHDFAHENAFRDVVDMGTTSELRLVTNLQSGLSLTSAALEYVTETVFSAGQGA